MSSYHERETGWEDASGEGDGGSELIYYEKFMQKSEINIETKKLLSSFVDELASTFELENVLYLWISSFDLFSEITNEKAKSIKISESYWAKEAYNTIVNLSEKFDFIIGDLPFWMLSWSLLDNPAMKSLEDELIFQTSRKLANNWLWVFIVDSWFFYRQDKKLLIESLEKQGLYINACFNLPKNTLAPYTNLQPILIVISYNKTGSLFISEILIASDIGGILLNFRNQNSFNLDNGILVPIEWFKWFTQYKIQDNMKKLSTIYSEFDKYILSDIAEAVALKDDLEIQDTDNCIFFPCVWNSPILSDSRNFLITQKNYYQVKLDSNKAIAEYVWYFFRSELWNLIRSALFTWEIIPHISKLNLLSIELPLPDLGTQKKIIDTYRRLNDLKQWIVELENELSINPVTSWILEEMKNIEESIWRMKKHDLIVSLIVRWESKTLEFKKCLGAKDKNNINWYSLTTAVLKTICAFLNTDWWILLVWVMDDGNIFWIENDTWYSFKSKDDYLKYFHNLIIRWIWWEYTRYINYDIENVNWKNILIIQCKRSNTPVYFLEGDQFYIRTNPATDELKSKGLVDYVNSHFKNNA